MGNATSLFAQNIGVDSQLGTGTVLIGFWVKIYLSQTKYPQRISSAFNAPTVICVGNEGKIGEPAS